MALLNDVSVGAIGDDPKKQVESLVKQINEQGRLISNEDRTRIIKDESGTPRVLFGEGPNQFYGMKVSKEGFDVTDAENDDLIFNSNQNVLKVVDVIDYTATSDLTITYPGGATYNQSFNTMATIPHGLTYVPAVIGYLYNNNIYTLMPFTAIGGAGTAALWVTHSIVVDDTNVYILADAVSTGTGSSAVITTGETKWKIYLLQESAN